MSLKYQRNRRQRKGAVLILTVITIVLMFGLVALSVDLGVAFVRRSELQRSADAAAIAAASDLLEQRFGTPDGTLSDTDARQTGQQFAAHNLVGSTAPAVPVNDMEIGVLSDRTNSASTMLAGNGASNAARVRIDTTTPYYFARIFGFTSVDQEIRATAAYLSGFEGFEVPSDGSNIDILPFALDRQTWDDLLANPTDDNWSWNATTGTISSGSDGECEVNLYPQGTGSPGNRGTVDIGHSGNSTNDIKRQILYGISADDLAYHGGSLEFDANGEILLNGDTGISAAVKTQLEAIKGEPRIIPIFDSVSGNGNNANYVITEFVGIRIMEVKLTGKMSAKRVIVQPATVQTMGGIPATTANPPTTYVFSPVTLLH